MNRTALVEACSTLHPGKAIAAVLLSTLYCIASPAATVAVENGELAGLELNGVTVFKGIPFAQPPVGPLRWKAPQPAARWKGVRTASAFGADCMQLPYRHDAAPLAVPPSEDCLYLNVWTPKERATRKRPVMVWIYGGGFVNGGSSSPVYDGSAFAQSGVVFVSFNYRLGRLGFFAHPALTREAGGEPLGNYGLMDQIAALKWVRRNIAAFGGDPENITVFGESAGAMSVHVLLVSPLAKGLFAKAIVESGGGGRPMLHGVRTLDDAEKQGVAFGIRKGIPKDDPASLSKLRALSGEQIVDGLNLMNLFGTDFTAPFIDGRVVIGFAADQYRNGSRLQVPLLIGANSADGFFGAGTLDEAYAPLASVRAEAQKVYDPEDTRDAARIGMAISADMLMIEPTRSIARMLSNEKPAVYLYRFAYVPEYLRDKLSGALHASEIPFIFNTLESRHGKSVSANDTAIARLMHDYWVAFAVSGVPSAPGKAIWPRYRPHENSLMQFGADGAHVGADPLQKRLDFIESLETAAVR